MDPMKVGFRKAPHTPGKTTAITGSRLSCLAIMLFKYQYLTRFCDCRLHQEFQVDSGMKAASFRFPPMSSRKAMKAFIEKRSMSPGASSTTPLCRLGPPGKGGPGPSAHGKPPERNQVLPGAEAPHGRQENLQVPGGVKVGAL